jgi:hypothetical protein
MTMNIRNIAAEASSVQPADSTAAVAARFHTQAFATPEEQEAASRLPIDRRQWMIQNLIVKYKVFNTAFQQIANNHMPVAGGTHAQGTVGAMLGESRAGKSAVCSYYAAMHPPKYDDEGELFPVVHLTASLRMSPVEFAHEINRLTAARHMRTTGGIGAYVDNAILRLLRVRAELLIIDDAQYLFFDRTDKTAADMFKLVKRIADFNALSIVLVGEERINDYVYSIDAFANRGYNWVPIKPLTAGKKDMEKFAKLLGSIDRRLPFANLSQLDDPYIAEHLYRFSGGMIGRVMNVIRPAAFLALNEGSSQVMLEHLRTAVSTRLKKGDTFSYFGFERDAS